MSARRIPKVELADLNAALATQQAERCAARKPQIVSRLRAFTTPLSPAQQATAARAALVAGWENRAYGKSQATAILHYIAFGVVGADVPDYFKSIIRGVAP